MKANLAKGFHRLETMLTNRNDKIERLQSINAELLAALKEIAHDTVDFEHGDANTEIFVRGLGSKAKTARDKARE